VGAGFWLLCVDEGRVNAHLIPIEVV
jgi:hypothetical protein